MELIYTATVSWPRLYQTYCSLDEPHCKKGSTFYATRRCLGQERPGFPFCDQYMINAARAQELIPPNIALAHDIELDLADPVKLRDLRYGTRDPALTKKLRAKAKSSKVKKTIQTGSAEATTVPAQEAMTEASADARH
ncbi:MAG: hypothetical protein Q9166_006856 [cf. Caloplaca sp. 2 TL-2023]